jgi:hypothetical protein
VILQTRFQEKWLTRKKVGLYYKSTYFRLEKSGISKILQKSAKFGKNLIKILVSQMLSDPIENSIDARYLHLNNHLCRGLPVLGIEVT